MQSNASAARDALVYIVSLLIAVKANFDFFPVLKLMETRSQAFHKGKLQPNLEWKKF